VKNKQTNFKSINGTPIDNYQDNEKFREYRRLWDECPREGKVAPFPLNVDLEVTNACNLRCPHCARTQNNWGKGEVGFVDKEVVRKVIREIADKGGYCMKFSLRGEPLLHPEIVTFLKWAKDANLLDYYFNTNGMLLSQKMAREFVEMEIPRISISVGGWNEKTFELCQAGAKMEVVRENIRYLKEYRDKKGSEYPIIRVQAVTLEELTKHMEEFKKLWTPLSNEIGLIDFREETGKVEHTAKTCKEFKCNFLWQRLVVLWDGSTYPCLFHGVKDPQDLYLGNVKEKSLKEMWQGEKMKELRKLHLEGGSHLSSSCAKCSYRNTEVEKIKIKNKL